MEQLKVYNRDGNVTGEMAAPDFLSSVWNAGLVHQVFKAIAANKREPIAHTKNRGEVRGGGIKPWKQKGTGRARQGSIRSPLWRHGGISFGPRNTTDYSQKTNKKMLKKSLRSALAKKLASGELKVVNNLTSENSKTKELAGVVQSLSRGKSALLVVSNSDKSTLRAARNLKRSMAVTAKDLNVLNVLSHTNILIDQKALSEIK